LAAQTHQKTAATVEDQLNSAGNMKVVYPHREEEIFVFCGSIQLLSGVTKFLHR